MKNSFHQLREANINCRLFMVFNPMCEEWDQLSVGFETFEEAKAFFDRQDREKYPYLRILAELDYNSNTTP